MERKCLRNALDDYDGSMNLQYDYLSSVNVFAAKNWIAFHLRRLMISYLTSSLLVILRVNQ